MKHAFLDNTLSCKSVKCLEKLEVLHEYKPFKHKPKQCPNCESKKLDGLEIIGAGEGAIFWECDNCMFKFLKYSIEDTLELLRDAEEYWYNPRDWLNNIRN